MLLMSSESDRKGLEHLHFNFFLLFLGPEAHLVVLGSLWDPLQNDVFKYITGSPEDVPETVMWGYKEFGLLRRTACCDLGLQRTALTAEDSRLEGPRMDVGGQPA